MNRAAICNSDIHTLQGRRQEPVPSVLGHEGCGSVLLSRRDGVNPEDRVTFSVTDICGTCLYCVQGPEQKCVQVFKYGHVQYVKYPQGCYSTHLLLRAGTRVVQLPDTLSFDSAASVNCALATMVAARRTALNILGDRSTEGSCLIYGAGLLGIYGAVLMKDSGFEVNITDPSPGRIQTAEKFGAKGVSGEEIDSSYFDLIIEACGVGRIVESALPRLKPGGVLILVGSVTPETRFTISGESLVRQCGSIVGVHNYQQSDLQVGVRFLERTSQVYDYSVLSSQPIPLSRFNSALELAKQNTYHRVLLDLTK